MDGGDEIVLAGGNMEPVVRVGDTVRRTAGPWTPAVHELLRCYEAAGVTQAPHALGIDEHGREVLSFLHGDVMTALPPEDLWSTVLLCAAGELLRALHDASRPLVAADATWRQESRDPAEVICHNDFAPYNLIVRGRTLVGVIDVDMASPGPRIWDLAYLAYRLVPFAEDAPAFDPGRDGTRAARRRTLLRAYGAEYDDREVKRACAQRLEVLATFTDERARVTGRSDFLDHAAMYRRDAARLLAAAGPHAR